MRRDGKFSMNIKYIVPVIAVVALAPMGAAAKIGNLWSFDEATEANYDENGQVMASNHMYAPADLDQQLSGASIAPAYIEEQNAPQYAPAAAPQYAPTQQQYAPAQQYQQAAPNYGYAPYGAYAPAPNYGGYPGGSGNTYSPFGYGTGIPFGNSFGSNPFNNGGYGGSYGSVPSGSSPFFGGSSPFGFW